MPNTAVVAATNEIPGATANNTDSDSVLVQCPDIKVTKDADNSPISAGETASFTIKVENIGQGKAYDVTLTDTLPTEVTTWTEDSDACSITDGVLSCDFGTMLPGATPHRDRVGRDDRRQLRHPAEHRVGERLERARHRPRATTRTGPRSSWTARRSSSPSRR